MAIITGGVELRFKGETDLWKASDIINFTYRETVYGLATFEGRIRSQEWRVWDGVIKDNGRSISTLRFGALSGGSLASEWSPWKSVLVNHVAVQGVTRGFADVYIRGYEAGYLLAKKTRSKGFVKMKVSDIVGHYASINNLDQDILDTKGEVTSYQCNYSDYHFIRGTLLEKALDGAGRGGYLFYFINGKKLVFKPPDLNDLLYTFAISTQEQNQPHEVVRISLVMNESRQFTKSSVATQFRGFDPLKKEALFFDADEDTTSYEVLPGILPKPSGLPCRVTPIAEPNLMEGYNDKAVKERGNASWTRDARGLFRGVITAWPLPQAYPGSVVDLDIKDNVGATHFSSGRWFVHGVTHKLTNRGYVTALHLERRTHQ